MKQSPSKKYKAFMLDIDGTVIKYDYNSLPSQSVVNTIKKAQSEIQICLVTGRSSSSIEHILKKLELNKGYAVINNGANVINIKTGKILYDKPIETQDIKKIIKILNEYNIPFYIKQNHNTMGLVEGYYLEKAAPKKGYMFYTDDTHNPKIVEDIIKKLSIIPTISVHKSQHKQKGKYGVNITNAEATKLHGISIVKTLLKVSTDEIIGIGDGYNDFPLLLACGLKIAMGNAVPELKEIADYIAPDVNEDGVAYAINKFILNEN